MKKNGITWTAHALVGVIIWSFLIVSLHVYGVNLKCHELSSGNGGSSGRDNLGHADSCIGQSPCSGQCKIWVLNNNGDPLPNGEFCLECYGDDCGCTTGPGPLDCYSLEGICRSGQETGGPDPCYCEFELLVFAKPTQIWPCAND
jgi:hypothetical protein